MVDRVGLHLRARERDLGRTRVAHIVSCTVFIRLKMQPYRRARLHFTPWSVVEGWTDVHVRDHEVTACRYAKY